MNLKTHKFRSQNLVLGGLAFICFPYKNSVSTAESTKSAIIAKTNFLILFREVIASQCNNDIKQKTHCLAKCISYFLILIADIYIYIYMYAMLMSVGLVK